MTTVSYAMILSWVPRSLETCCKSYDTKFSCYPGPGGIPNVRHIDSLELFNVTVWQVLLVYKLTVLRGDWAVDDVRFLVGHITDSSTMAILLNLGVIECAIRYPWLLISF
jgi:hypothetical protein